MDASPRALIPAAQTRFLFNKFPGSNAMSALHTQMSKDSNEMVPKAAGMALSGVDVMARTNVSISEALTGESEYSSIPQLAQTNPVAKKFRSSCMAAVAVFPPALTSPRSCTAKPSTCGMGCARW